MIYYKLIFSIDNVDHYIDVSKPHLKYPIPYHIAESFAISEEPVEKRIEPINIQEQIEDGSTYIHLFKFKSLFYSYLSNLSNFRFDITGRYHSSYVAFTKDDNRLSIAEEKLGLISPMDDYSHKMVFKC